MTSTKSYTKRLMVIFGTRPEAIKMAPLICELKKIENVEVQVCVTGQHRQMLDQVLELFNISPDFDLNLMQKMQTLSTLTAKALEGLHQVLAHASPDLVFVHGDTTTSFAASLAAFYQKIPIAHVEAGLRTGDILSPWPEEMNRKVVGSIAAIHFAPTSGAAINLINEGVPRGRIHITGNTVIDALIDVSRRIKEDQLLTALLEKRFLKIKANKKLVLVTGHRRENFGSGFEQICQGLLQLSQREDVEIVYPVHLNPQVQEPVHRILGGKENVHLIEPLDYVPFIYLMNRSFLILTDSGGVQEEAPSLGKPVLVMRETTERPEAVEAGTVKLVGPNAQRIFLEAERLLDDAQAREAMTRAHNPYGDGLASTRISRVIKNWLFEDLSTSHPQAWNAHPFEGTVMPDHGLPARM